ncbi:cysteinyl-tRNA synthetase [Perkinsela sp. CCAP 1560/4]|nr:cysteinyl-tRNA synthetase [Perkinsela sp. CCAP 1560/4]KNH08171.1 cysteinyl-tRNA synthetase [Perkinsela sp. CCAP 1560/4]|eukprot:KNH00563.1 cysteinyl-tRNA synthetase [Perkinsela sp. CCAP 1560/4]
MMNPPHRSQRCALNVSGLSSAGVYTEKHPAWFPPSGTLSPQPQLRVLNSLTETVEPFIPRDGRTVKWYVCGPTVYDSAHMGHARAYLTFDIIRRVMQEYFQLNVMYQMNITDIDDKIIKRARVNSLLKAYTEKVKNLEYSVLDTDIGHACAMHTEQLSSRRVSIGDALQGPVTRKQKDELEEKMKELSLKVESLDETTRSIEKLRSQSFATADEKISAVLRLSRDILGEWLDKENHGQTFDNEIFENHARTYESEFMEDMAALNVLPPDHISRVTEFLPQIIAFIQQVIENGFAYIGATSVFFDLNAYERDGHAYPKLKPIASALDKKTSAFEMSESEGVMYSSADISDKQNPNDFALWKFSKPGEASWESPWGRGRPGWHIECSAMASEFLGANIDIHGGGWDLKFPHHDNEIAQSEAYWGNGQWVNYFLHAGHLHIKGLKMAKSLKNFSTIRETLQDYTADDIRMVFLLQPWFKPMNFSAQVIAEGKEKLRVITSFLGNTDAVCRTDPLHRHQPLGEGEKALYANASETNKVIHDALCDNLNTPRCVEGILELISNGNKYLQSTVDNASGPTHANTSLLRRVQTEIRKPLEVFGLKSLSHDNSQDTKGEAVQDGILDAFVSFRDTVRDIAKKEKVKSLFSACDAVRDEHLPPLGVRLEDSTQSQSRWRYQNPVDIMKEIQMKKESEGKKKK